MTLPWEDPDNDVTERQIAEGVSNLLASAFGADFGFDEDDPDTERAKEDATVYLLGRIAAELQMIRYKLYDRDDPYGEDWR